MLKILIKFLPALIPIITYFLWIFLLREIFLLRKTRKELSGSKPKIIDIKKPNILSDPKFFLSIILSAVILIVMFIFLAITSIKDKGDIYVPAIYEDGKIVPAQKINEEEK
jgi:hypothetical protein